MSEFKVGDKVICISELEAEGITKNKEYLVVRDLYYIFGLWYMDVKNDEGVVCGYRINRFRSRLTLIQKIKLFFQRG